MRAFLVAAVLVLAACRAVPAPPPPGADHPGSPEAREPAPPAFLGTTSTILVAPATRDVAPPAMRGGLPGGRR